MSVKNGAGRTLTDVAPVPACATSLQAQTQGLGFPFHLATANGAAGLEALGVV
ncbi:MAG: hypothetical protein JO110_04300 [Acetobacteraceae bacterium]|nr:hypothetical protein [Acetobacteraceae bacterium]